MAANLGIRGLPPGERRPATGIRNMPVGVTTAAVTVPDGANRASFQQANAGLTHVPRGVIGYCGVSSGNMCISVFSSTLSNDSSGVSRRRPSHMIATTGLVACPSAAANFFLPFTQTAECAPGDWLMLWADNVTATFAAYVGSNAYGNGYQYNAGAVPPTQVQSTQALTLESRWFNLETVP